MKERVEKPMREKESGRKGESAAAQLFEHGSGVRTVSVLICR